MTHCTACPVCNTGEIRARTPAALARRACCSRRCALAIAREVRRSRLPSPAERAARVAQRERTRLELIALVHSAPALGVDLPIRDAQALKRDLRKALSAVGRGNTSSDHMQWLTRLIRADLKGATWSE